MKRLATKITSLVQVGGVRRVRSMTPRSTRLRLPPTIVAIAPSRSSGMPRLRAKLLAVPSGSKAKTQG